MDSSLRELFNQTLNLSPREKVDVARRALQEINQYLKKLELSDEQVTLFVVNITKLFVSIDNRKEDDEYYFFSSVIGADISQEYFNKMVEGGDDPKFVNAENTIGNAEITTKNKAPKTVNLPNTFEM